MFSLGKTHGEKGIVNTLAPIWQRQLRADILGAAPTLVEEIISTGRSVYLQLQRLPIHDQRRALLMAFSAPGSGPLAYYKALGQAIATVSASDAELLSILAARWKRQAGKH